MHNTNPNALHIHFEDLIYNYDKTVHTIESFLGLSQVAHLRKQELFVPDKSIENTQAFWAREEWLPEAQHIEENLTEYLYQFPYKRVPSIRNMFDSPNR